MHFCRSLSFISRRSAAGNGSLTAPFRSAFSVLPGAGSIRITLCGTAFVFFSSSDQRTPTDFFCCYEICLTNQKVFPFRTHLSDFYDLHRHRCTRLLLPIPASSITQIPLSSFDLYSILQYVYTNIWSILKKIRHKKNKAGFSFGLVSVAAPVRYCRILLS